MMYFIVFVFVKSNLKNSRDPAHTGTGGWWKAWMSKQGLTHWPPWQANLQSRILYRTCARNAVSLTLLISFVKSEVIIKMSNQVNSLPNVCKCEGTQKSYSPQRSLPVYKHIANLKALFLLANIDYIKRLVYIQKNGDLGSSQWAWP